MRLSADIISNSEQRSNPLGEREIILRGLAIPSIEHLGATRDLFDTIDFCDNRITHLENFPRLQRLSSLLLSGNSIDTIDARNLAKNLPNLTNLVLTNNRIGGLHEIGNIADGCKKLEYLTMTGNKVTRRQHYRLYTIHRIPTLKVLDFIKIKKSERSMAKRLAMSTAGATLEGDVEFEARQNALKAKSNTFNPGEGKSAKESFLVSFTKEQKSQIKDMIANAISPEEIETIEECVKRGEFPESHLGQKRIEKDEIEVDSPRKKSRLA